MDMSILMGSVNPKVELSTEYSTYENVKYKIKRPKNRSFNRTMRTHINERFRKNPYLHSPCKLNKV